MSAERRTKPNPMRHSRAETSSDMKITGYAILLTCVRADVSFKFAGNINIRAMSAERLFRQMEHARVRC